MQAIEKDLQDLLLQISTLLEQPHEQLLNNISMVCEKLNEMGNVINRAFSGSMEAIDLASFNKLLFHTFVALKKIVNILPKTPQFVEANVVARSLTYFVMNNFVYTSLTEEDNITAFVYTISDLLLDLPKPQEIYSSIDLGEMDNQFFLQVYRLHDGFSDLHYSVLQKAICVPDSDLISWSKAYFDQATFLLKIIKDINHRIDQIADVELAVHLFDRAVSTMLYFTTFVYSLLAMFKDEVKTTFDANPAELVDMVKERLKVVMKIYEKLKKKNNFEDKSFISEQAQRKLLLAQFGIRYCNSIIEFYSYVSSYFQKQTTLNTIDILIESQFGTLQRLNEIHNILNTPIGNSLFTPVAVSISNRILSLLYLKEALKPKDVSIINFIETTFAETPIAVFHQLLITTKLKQFKTLNFQEVLGSIKQLKKNIQLVMADVVAFSLLMALVEGLANDTGIDPIRLEAKRLSTMINEKKVPYRFIAGLNNFASNCTYEGQLQINPYDYLTWVMPILPLHKIKWYPFNSEENRKRRM